MNSSNSASSPAPSTAGRWRTARRLLVATAAVATLLAVFYTVENWRGQRAWQNSRRELEAKGEVLDWAAYIPAPVSDAQNFYKAPRMQEWFVKEHFAIGGPQPPDAPFVPALGRGTNLVLAEVQVVPANAPLDSERADAVLRFADPLARDQAARLLGQTLGPCALGARMCVLVARPLEQIKPV
ncbi:MAG TPA: hypothetical protein VNZ22_00335, partial [Bacillota bacterium]|nr:hypothetical protein [Bacillota bacterium]